MSNPYIEYYTNQAGSGLAGFEGYRYQRGHGFFSSIFQNILKPLGRYLGRTALQTGINVGSDYLQNNNLKESLDKNIKLTSKKMLGDSIARAQKYAQTGTGRRRRKRTSVKTIKKKVTKKTKTVKKKSSVKRVAKRKRSVKSKFAHLF